MRACPARCTEIDSALSLQVWQGSQPYRLPDEYLLRTDRDLTDGAAFDPEKRAMNITIHGIGSSSGINMAKEVQEWRLPHAVSNDWTNFNWRQFVGDNSDPFHDISLVIRAMVTAGRILFNPNAEASLFKRQFILAMRCLTDWAEALVTACLLVIASVPMIVFLVHFLQGIFVTHSAGFLASLIDIPSLVLQYGSFVAILGVLGVPAVSILLAVPSARPSLLAASLCWSALVLARPIVYLYFVPHLLAGAIVALGERFSEGIANLIFMSCIGVALGIITMPLSGYKLSELIFGLWPVALVLCVFLLLLGLVTIIRYVLAPTLGAMLDIFRYVGDPGYRMALQNHFDQIVLSRSDDNITILAHSLGTVIAVDSLVNSRVWNKQCSVTLITAGSPLRRFFFQFFPGLLFPTSSRLVAQEITKRVAHFRWLNVYRPLDQVGTSLRLTAARIGMDVRVPQWGKVLTAHINYFSDLTVRSAIHAALTGLAWDQKTYSGISHAFWSASGSRQTPQGIKVVTDFSASLVVLIPLAMTGWGLYLSPNAIHKQNLIDKQLNSELQLQPVISSYVEHWVRPVQMNNGSSIPQSVDLDNFRFTFNDRKSKPREFAIERNNAQDDLFRVEDVRQFVRADCQFLEHPALLQRNITVRCRSRRPVQLRWLSSDPLVFELPDFPGKPADEISRAVETIILYVIHVGASLLTGFVLSLVVAHGVTVFAGEDFSR